MGLFVSLLEWNRFVTPASLPNEPARLSLPYRGLAPFLRMSIAGIDMRPLTQAMLAKAGDYPDDADFWMSLATLSMATGYRDPGLSIQGQALELSRIYRIAAAEQPPRLTILLLMTDGDLAANTPLDCLLENSDIELIQYYLSPQHWFEAPLPDHDVVMVAMGESDDNREMLNALDELLPTWPRPVLNLSSAIPNVGRVRASELLQGVPGLLMPPTFAIARAQLAAIAAGQQTLTDELGDCEFPIIIRPVGSHGGHDLERIANAAELAAYLQRVPVDALFVSRFIDYSGQDGQFRKARIALVAGEPYVCHMAVSSHWMVHYVNAGMYEEAAKREEEGRFMDDFPAFVARHRAALDAIAQRAGLDYVCIDCAETQDGQLLVFEIDHAMVVHAMDLESMFPYKQAHIAKVRDAFRLMAMRKAGWPRGL